MVVSAILTTALAPVTGALFGASYGTAIRIGYEIIFPALFGKTKPNPDAQDVIKSLHTMFTATGGVAALEFGIDQGIQMAKKKTDSPEIQHLINTDLGITEPQLLRAGRGGGVSAAAIAEQDLTGAQEFPDVTTFTPSGDIGNFQNQTWEVIKEHFSKLTKNQFVTNLRLLDDEANLKPINEGQLRNYHKLLKAIFFQRFGTPDTTDKIIQDQPTTSDATRRDFDAKYIILQNDWHHFLAIWTATVKQRNAMPGTNKLGRATLLIKINKNKNTVLDRYKKLTNFLVLAKNNPQTRLLSIAKTKLLSGAFG